MAKSRYPLAGHGLETAIANLLRGGVALSAAVVIIGGALYLLRHGAERPDYGVFRGEPAELRSLGGIVANILSFHSLGVIELGVLLLLATPVARVAFLVFGFLREGDYKYVAISFTVLMILLFTIFRGTG
jgi:uncharacterized membrane protein